MRVVVKDPKQRVDLNTSFHKNGPLLIMLARAMPMLPEVTACLAGATKMSFLKFVACALTGAIPYTLIAAYAGSVSSFENPQPAVYAVMVFYLVSWSAWGISHAFKRKQANVKDH